ncbi:hypothetical protein MHYP_G00034130 [Metynnis hypsauchen]
MKRRGRLLTCTRANEWRDQPRGRRLCTCQSFTEGSRITAERKSPTAETFRRIRFPTRIPGLRAALRASSSGTLSASRWTKADRRSETRGRVCLRSQKRACRLFRARFGRGARGLAVARGGDGDRQVNSGWKRRTALVELRVSGRLGFGSRCSAGSHKTGRALSAATRHRIAGWGSAASLPRCLAGSPLRKALCCTSI